MFSSHFFECNDDNDHLRKSDLVSIFRKCRRYVSTESKNRTVLVKNSLKPFNVDQSGRIKRFGVFA